LFYQYNNLNIRLYQLTTLLFIISFSEGYYCNFSEQLVAFAQEGIHAGLIGRTLENLQQVAEELKQYDVKVAIAVANVGDLESITTAIESIRGELGAIDILVNNARISKFGNSMAQRLKNTIYLYS
jgi:NADP-dependent 3-hydroxy acid dehydrogenase YdfG